MVITPTVGRVVWVRNRSESIDHTEPEAALVAYVHSDRCINVGGFDANGHPFQLTSLTLVQAGDEKPEHTYAEWMPYQKGQAAKTEALEAQQRDAAGRG